MISDTSRRVFIGATGTLAMASLIPVAAARASVSRINPQLLRLMALHDRVEAECERFDVHVEAPAREACVAAIRNLPAEAQPPHQQCTTTFVNAFGERIRLSTENVHALTTARAIANNDPFWADADEDWKQAHRELVAATDARNAVLAGQTARRKALEQETFARFRIDAIAARSEALAERRCRLWWAAVSSPVACLNDVVTKLDFINRTIPLDECTSETFVAIAADVRQLAGEA